MTEGKGILFIGVILLAVAGFYILSGEKIPFIEEEAIINFLDDVQVPNGVGMAGLRTIGDGLWEEAGAKCEEQYGLCQRNAPNCVVNQCCAYEPILRYDPIGSPPIFGVQEAGRELLNAEFKEPPDFFEDDPVQIFTLVLNPDENKLSEITELPVEAYVYIWIEREVFGSRERAEAIRLYGKPITYTDLSKRILLTGQSQEIDVTLAGNEILPIGEYNYYAVITIIEGERNVQIGAGCDTRVVSSPKFRALSKYINANFLVNPKLLTYFIPEGTTCTEGYEIQNPLENNEGICNPIENNEGCVCVRTDLKDLPCSRIGCPINVNFTYSCGSDGYCSEQVWQYKRCETDIDCGPDLKCEPSSGICFRKEVYNNFIQCETNLDCFDPNCRDSNGNEVTAECINNNCVYSNQCDVELLDCFDRGCEPGFTCTEDEEVGGRCIRNEEEKAPPAEEEKEGEKGFFSSKINLFIIIIIIALIGVYLLLKKD